MSVLYSTESNGKGLAPCPFLPSNISDRWDTHGYIQQSDPIRSGECSAQLVPWPYANDLAGIPFDQGNLWGVRPYAALPTGDSSIGLLIAVPKTLPAGYTQQMLRCRGAVQIFNQGLVIGNNGGSYGNPDALLGGYQPPGDSDFVYNSYRIRTARGTFPTPAKAIYGAWIPKNANDQAVSVSADSTLVIWDSSGGKWMHMSGIFGVQHGGYRGGKIAITYRDSSPVLGSGGNSGNFYLTIGCDPDPLAFGASPSTTLYSTTFDIMSMTPLGPSGAVYVWEKNFTIPAGLVPTLGKSEYFYMLFGRDQTWYDGVFNVGASFGPRTDIPLWFPITYGNTCVKGGIPNGAY